MTKLGSLPETVLPEKELGWPTADTRLEFN